MKRIRMFVLLVAAVSAIAVGAQEAEKPVPGICKHEFRLGVGDNFTDLFIGAFHYYELRGNYTTPNIFLDYTYHVCPWFGLGLQVNTIWWGGENYEHDGTFVGSYLYGNTSVMPVLRFTYFRVPKNNVALYSSVYGGYCAGIDKTNNKSVYTHGFAAGLTALGVSFGGEHWFGAAELGMLFGFGGNTQLGSRILSVAAGYRF